MLLVFLFFTVGEKKDGGKKYEDCLVKQVNPHILRRIYNVFRMNLVAVFGLPTARLGFAFVCRPAAMI